MAFIVMHQQGINANIMSLGGIAIAIGAMVDAAIIMIENAHKHIERDGGRKPHWEIISDAAIEVGPALFYSLLVITVSFMPVFTLEAQEGRLFKPLAFTKTYSMAAAALLSVTLVPVLMGYFIRGKILPEQRNPLNRFLIWLYHPILEFVLRFKYLMLAVAVLMVAVTVIPFERLGSEFMPPLWEGDLLYMPTMLPGVSITKAREVLQQTDKIIKTFPEVEHVFGKVGRAETATDPAPLSMIETTITLKPESQWPKGMTVDKLTDADGCGDSDPGRNQRLDHADQDAHRHALHRHQDAGRHQAGRPGPEYARKTGQGYRGGHARRAGHAQRLRRARHGRQLPGFHHRPRCDRALRPDRRRCAGCDPDRDRRHGHHHHRRGPGAIPGESPLQPRLSRRHSRARIGPGSDAAGQQIPLGQLASVKYVLGPPAIKSEGARPNAWIYVDLRGIDVGTYVQNAQKVVAEKIKLPTGYTIAWSGQYEYMQRAKKRLMYVIPLTVVIIFVIIFLNTKSLIKTAIVFLAVPFSLVGAIWLIYLLGYNMSVAVWVGIIALAGLDAETGVVMLLYLDQAYEDFKERGVLNNRNDLADSIYEGAVKRVRPKVMTICVIVAGLVPILWSQGAGADVMKRIATPMVGGVVTSGIMELAIYPIIFYLWRSHRLPKGGPFTGFHHLRETS